MKSNNISRRAVLKVFAVAGGSKVLATLPKDWRTPVVTIGALPVHTATSQTITYTIEIPSRSNVSCPDVDLKELRITSFPPVNTPVQWTAEGVGCTITNPTPDISGKLSDTWHTDAAGISELGAPYSISMTTENPATLLFNCWALGASAQQSCNNWHAGACS